MIAACVHAEPPSRDVAWSKRTEISVIPDKNTGFRLRLKGFYSQTLLNERALGRQRFVIYEASGSSVDHVKMQVNGGKMSGNQTWSEVADNQEIFLTDSRFHYLYFPGPFKVGDSLSYSFEQEYPDAQILDLIKIHNFGFMRSTIVDFKHPADVKVKAELFCPRGEVKMRECHPGNEETTFIFDSLDEVADLPGFAFNAEHAVVRFSLSCRDSAVTVSSAADMIAWYRTKVNLEPIIDSTYGRYFDSLMAPDLSDLQKLQVIHGWVCRNIRYISNLTGGHSFFPHSPDSVLAAQFGDCKDRAYLVCALARRYGIRVCLGLASHDFEPDLTGLHPALFDHVVCVYQDADSSLVFDPTAPLHPFGALPVEIVGHPLFVLDPVNPRYETIRAQDTMPDLSIHIDAHADSLASSRATVELRGDLLAAARYALVFQTAATKETILSTIIGASLSQIHFRDCAVVADSGRFMVITASADLSRFAVTSAGRRYLPRTPFALVSRELLSREKDTLPIQLDSVPHQSLSIRLTAPGAKAASDSCVISDGPDSFFRAMIFQDKTNEIAISYAASRSGKTFKGEKKESYLEFCRRYLAAKTGMFVISEEGR